MLSNTTTWPVFFQYHNLLRADLDTFPTPLLRDDWPDDLQINAMAGYATQKSRAMLARVGEEAGVFYDGISNIASTYWGDAVSVVKLTCFATSASAYVRAAAFSEGSPCHLPYHLRPDTTDCEWSSGLWEGVMTMYATELAFNHLLHTKSMEATIIRDRQFFDYPSSGPGNVCYSKLVHCYHGRERFAKMPFSEGLYRTFDMSQLRMAVTSDFATYMALTSNQQGHGGEAFADVAFDKMCDEVEEGQGVRTPYRRK